jgi:hypothetical protein
MTNTRAKIGFGDALDDLASFTPGKPAKTVAEPGAAAAAGFKRREPTAAVQEIAAPQKVQRRRRTGRNVQINIKAKQETLEQFYAAVDVMGCGVGEAFEVAVDLLKKKLSES